MNVLLIAWTFRVFLPAGEMTSVFALDDRVVLTVQGGIAVMDTTGTILGGIPTVTSPVLAVLSPDRTSVYWVDGQGDLYSGNLETSRSVRLVHVGEGHSLATDGQRIFFGTLSNRVITLDLAGFPRHGPRPTHLSWAGLWGEVPESHTSRVFLDPVRTRATFYQSSLEVAWVLEDSGLVRLDLRTGRRREYGFPIPPIYPLSGVFLSPVPGVYGEGGVALEENGRWRWIVSGERVVGACPPDRYLSPFSLFIWQGGPAREFPLNGGPFEHMVCANGHIWVGGPNGVQEVNGGLLLSVDVRDLAWNGGLWVGSSQGLFVLRDTMWERLQDTAGVLSGEVVDLAPAKDKILVATPFGVLTANDGLRVLSRHSVERLTATKMYPVGFTGTQLVELRPEGLVPIYTPVDLRNVVDLAAGMDTLVAATPEGLWWFR